MSGGFLVTPRGGKAQRTAAYAPAQVCIHKEFPGRRHHLPNSPCHLAQGVSEAAQEVLLLSRRHGGAAAVLTVHQFRLPWCAHGLWRVVSGTEK